MFVYHVNPNLLLITEKLLTVKTNFATLLCENFYAFLIYKRKLSLLNLQDDYMEALNKLNLTVTKAYKINPNIKFEVFIHKVDGLGDDFKMESQRDIQQRATDDLNDSGIK